MLTSEYFEKVEEFLYDVQRVITPRWLSRELGIRISLAKRLLSDFYEAERTKARFKKIAAVHVVAGTPKSGESGSYEVTLAANGKLAECKSRFSDCVVEIYSLFPSELTVSPASSIVNANCEHAISCGEDFGRYDRIRSKTCMDLRSKEEIERLRLLAFRSGESLGFTKHQPSAPVPQKAKAVSAISAAFAKKKPATGVPPRSSSESAPATKSQGGKDEPAKVVPPPAAPAPAPPKKQSPVKAKQNPLAAMFSRQAEKNKTAPPKPKVEKKKKEEEEDEKKKRVVEEEEMEKPPSAHSQKRKPESDEDSKKNKNKKPPPAKKQKTQTKASKKKEKPKLKRVMAMFSSSEDEEEDEDEEAADRRLRSAVEEPEEEAAKPTPDFASSDEEEDVVPATPKAQPENVSRGGKHKVKKWVEKTFLDEDGFMVTEKVMEEIEEEDANAADRNSESEEAAVEEKPSAKVDAKPETDKENLKKGDDSAPKGRGRPKKATSVTSGKQSSITSFFAKAK